jgi:hypothetical protein
MAVARYFFLILISGFLFVSCSKKYGIIRNTEAVERYDVEQKAKGCSVIRSIYCDIYVELLDSEKWNYLFTNHYFTASSLEHENYRFSNYPVLHYVIKNTGREPIKVERIVVEYGKNKSDSLTFQSFQSLHKSSAYKVFEFKKFFRGRRLLADKYCLKEIDYHKDTIPFRFDFIPPSDTVLKFTAFPWIPVEQRRFKVFFHIDYAGRKKILNFDFQKYEYRIKGDVFRKVEKKSGLGEDE